MQTREFVAKQAKLEKLVRDKDDYLSQFRDQAKELTSEIEEYLAKESMQKKVEAMSPAQKKAMADALGKGS